MADQPPTNDAIITAFLLALGTTLLGVGARTAIADGQVVAGILACVIGVAAMLFGTAWLRIKRHIPEPLTASLGNAATDARIWIAGVFTVLVYVMALSVYSASTGSKAGLPDTTESTRSDELLDRPIIDLVRMYDDHTSAQADQLTARFLGRRIAVRLPVLDVSPGILGDQMNVVAGDFGNLSSYVTMSFPLKWSQRLSAVTIGKDMIVTTCRIQKLGRLGATVTDCNSPDIVPLPTLTPTAVPSRMLTPEPTTKSTPVSRLRSERRKQ